MECSGISPGVRFAPEPAILYLYISESEPLSIYVLLYRNSFTERKQEMRLVCKKSPKLLPKEFLQAFNELCLNWDPANTQWKHCIEFIESHIICSSGGHGP